MNLTTHVLDASTGRPGSGIRVRLERHRTGQAPTLPAELAAAVTNADGRILAADWGIEASLEPGAYRLIFETEGYFARTNTPSFYPEIAVAFMADDPRQHYHVPLLLSPFSYSTYRGS